MKKEEKEQEKEQEKGCEYGGCGETAYSQWRTKEGEEKVVCHLHHILLSEIFDDDDEEFPSSSIFE
jgi:hypothetical protein